MTTLQELIKQACDDEYGEVRFRNDYSGRGMYGDRCIGITGSHRNLTAVIAQVIKSMALNTSDDEWYKFEEAVDTILGFSEDSMGLGHIYYWRGLEPLQDDQEAESEAEEQEEDI